MHLLGRIGDVRHGASHGTAETFFEIKRNGDTRETLPTSCLRESSRCTGTRVSTHDE